VAVGGGIDVTSMRVPHRDEYADTVGYRIEGPDVTVLYVPDTDRWETWDPPLESRLEGVDVVLLDGTFHGPGELPGRAIEDVPHPPMTVTMDRLQSRVDAGLRVVFTHLNHSNPAVDPSSEAARACRARGFEIARDGDETPLALPGGRRPPPRLSRRVDDSLALDDGARGALLPRGPGLHRRRLGLPSGAG
jgi:pyrroloquinoline quinone biosynthesis protein B